MKIQFLILPIAALFLCSCGMSPDEEMLYNYENNVTSKVLNASVDDLDFKILKVEKIDEVTGLDSAKYFKMELAKLWVGSESEITNDLLDTITFKKALFKINGVVDSYQRLIALKSSTYESTYSDEKELEDWQEVQDKVIFQKLMFEKYESKSDEILSYSYEGTYELKNPLMNDLKQTLSKIYYTNKEGTAFVSSESLEK